MPAVAHDPTDAPQTPLAEDPALDSLEARLAAARKAEDERLAKDHATYNEATGLGWNVVSTLVGYPLGGIVIGVVLDNLFDTLPWITIGLMFTAFAGALLQVSRITNNRNN
jgi:F0F1-type ATP synthase assembly protein I